MEDLIFLYLSGLKANYSHSVVVEITSVLQIKAIALKVLRIYFHVSRKVVNFPNT